MANYVRWTAQSPAEMDNAVVSYLRDGFTIASRTPTAVTLVKPKRFSIVMLLIGLLLFLLPLFIYLVYYLTLTDQVVEVVLSVPQIGMRSPDGYYWWDGAAWQVVAAAPAPNGVASIGAGTS